MPDRETLASRLERIRPIDGAPAYCVRQARAAGIEVREVGAYPAPDSRPFTAD